MVYPFRYVQEGGLRASRGSGENFFFQGLGNAISHVFQGEYLTGKKTLFGNTPNGEENADFQ